MRRSFLDGNNGILFNKCLRPKKVDNENTKWQTCLKRYLYWWKGRGKCKRRGYPNGRTHFCINYKAQAFPARSLMTTERHNKLNAN
jgi:hypothetical protein